MRVVHILEGRTSDGLAILRCRYRPVYIANELCVGRAQPARYHEVTCKSCLSKSAEPNPEEPYIPTFSRRWGRL